MDNQTSQILLIVVIVLLAVIIFIQVLSVIFHDKFQSYFTKHSKPIRKNKKTIHEIDAFINNVSTALAKLSFDKVGGIIVIENKEKLDKYINLGVQVKADFLPEFIVSVFYNHKSPLHDGAMIVRDLKIVSISSYLPLTRRILSVEYGARHRAAFGICEHYDCLSFVVSETNGSIAFSYKNIHRSLSNEPIKLNTELLEIFKSYWLHDN